MIYAYKIGDMVRLIGSEEMLTVTEQHWLREAPWYSVKTRWGLAGVAVREDQLEAADAVDS